MSLLCRGIRSLLCKPSVLQALQCVAPASLHTSSERPGIGEFIQYIRFNYYHDIRHHLDEDKWAKLFAVEGNIKSGKGAFAEELARKLELRHFPSAEFDYYLRNRRDMPTAQRDLTFARDSPLMKVFNISLDRTYTNPDDWPNIGRHQVGMIRSRYFQYAHALCHLLQTGNGAVLERSFYSLPVFHSAMDKLELLPTEVIDSFHVHMRTFESCWMLPPQVVLYLDVPPELCLEKIKEGGSPAEKHITLDYLKAIDKAYKTEYLPEATKRGSKVIHLDWSEPRSVDDVIFDLDDMPTLLAEYNRWDYTNHELKRMLRANSDWHAMWNRAQVFIPVEEMWDSTKLMQVEDKMKYTMPRFYWDGYVPGKDKLIWLKE